MSVLGRVEGKCEICYIDFNKVRTISQFADKSAPYLPSIPILLVTNVPRYTCICTIRLLLQIIWSVIKENTGSSSSILVYVRNVHVNVPKIQMYIWQGIRRNMNFIAEKHCALRDNLELLDLQWIKKRQKTWNEWLLCVPKIYYLVSLLSINTVKTFQCKIFRTWTYRIWKMNTQEVQWRVYDIQCRRYTVSFDDCVIQWIAYTDSPGSHCQ